jgi:hypothetical protein
MAEATGLEPAHAMRGDLANRCPTIRRRLHWRKGQESNLQALRAVVFRTTALPVRLPFRELVHVVGLAPTKDIEVRLIYSQVP